MRGIERGKCASGECEDFMRSDGATCSYCGCLLTPHSTKDGRYSSDSVAGTSGAGTSESASPERWKYEDLWRFLNPKGEYTEFSNSIIKMCKEKKKEETKREQKERLKRDYNDIDWVGLYNADKLSSLKVDVLSLYFSHQKITFKGKKAEKVAMIKAHIGSLL